MSGIWQTWLLPGTRNWSTQRISLSSYSIIHLRPGARLYSSEKEAVTLEKSKITRVRKAYSKAEDAVIIKHREIGTVFREIAEKLGRTTASVMMRHRILAVQSARPEDAPRLARPYTKSEDELIVSRMKKGDSLSQIAADLGRKHNSVYPHYHRHLVPSDPELSAMVTYDPKVASIVKRGLEVGKPARQIARENGLNYALVLRHYWKHGKIAKRSPVTPELRKRVLELKYSDHSTFDTAKALQLTPVMVNKIMREEYSKEQIHPKVRELLTSGKTVHQIAKQTKLPLPLIRNQRRRLSPNRLTSTAQRQRKTHVQWTEPMRQRVIRMWNAGASPADISRRVQKHRIQVQLALFKWNADLTRKYKTLSKVRYTTDEVIRIVSWRERSMAWKEIAARLPGRSESALRRIMHRHISRGTVDP